MAKKKGTKGYVAELNKLVRDEFGCVPAKLTLLIRKTAQDMLVLDRIMEELEWDDLTRVEDGSMGQSRKVCSPLLPYYDKLSSRVTDDFYNLGLTERKQAAKSEDTRDRKSTDKLSDFLNATIGE